MTWLVSLWDDRGHNLLTASVTDGELVAKLKAVAQDLKLRVEVKEQASGKAATAHE